MSIVSISAGAGGIMIECDYKKRCICYVNQNIETNELKDILDSVLNNYLLF